MSGSEPTTAPLQIGQQLGTYKILAHFAHDADQLRRFAQEARDFGIGPFAKLTSELQLLMDYWLEAVVLPELGR